MRTILLLLLVCSTIGAPVPLKLNTATRFRRNTVSLNPRQQRPPWSGPGGRQNGILFPGAPGQGAPQIPFQDAQPSDQTPPTESLNSAASLPPTNVPQPTGPASSVGLPPATTPVQSPPSNTISPFSPTSFLQSTTSLGTVSVGSPSSSSIVPPPAPSSVTAPSFSASFAQPLGQTYSAVVSVPTTFAQPSGQTNSTATSGSTTSAQPSGQANSTGVSVPANFPPVTAPNLTPTASISTTPLQQPSSPAVLPTASPGGPLQLSLVNNLNSNNAHAYVSALDASGRVVMLQPDGSFYYLPETGSPTPQAITADIAIPLPAQGQSLQIAIPEFVAGARIWFADGTLDFAVVSSVNGPALVEPTAVNRDDGSVNTDWGFVELSYVAGYGLFANLSFVDFVGLPLGLQLQTLSAGTQIVPGMPRDGVQQVCDRLRQYRGKAARLWSDLCVSSADGSIMRVISPAVLLSQQSGAFPGFFQRYVDQVWEAYTSTSLTIDTQNANGNVACQVVGSELQCAGSSRTYSKPTAEDIFGCNTGPFAIAETDNAIHQAVVPRLCAAFNRATLLQDGGNVQPALPPSSYYTARPYNVYSAAVHEVEAEGRGYAFSYDDVAPSVEQDVAGIVTAADPRLLTVFVGGM